jgi:aldehyde:ferredoxin oxidoreductase
MKLGVRGEGDTLPQRFLTEPRPSGAAAGVLPDLELMMAEYYRERGWTADGVPTEERLAALGLSE